MKLAFCLFKYFPFSGLSRDLVRIIEASRERGHEIHVFAAQWQGDVPEGVELMLLPGRRWMNHSQNASFFRRLKAELRKHEFDAIVGFNRMPGLDLYYGADYCYVGRARPKYPRLYRLTPRYHTMAKFEREVFGVHSNTDILSLSEREKDVYQQFYATPDKRFHLLPPTLDRKRIQEESRETVRARSRQGLGIRDDDIALLFIGSGFKTKGLDRAIDALASLPAALLERCTLRVVGEDSERNYRKLADNLDLGKRVVFLGGRSDIPELLAAGDLLIHPAYSENTGTVLLEAIAAGLPVLTTDVCGYASHIAEADAGVVLTSPFDQTELNNELVNMLNSPLRDQWSRNGIAYGANPGLYTMPETAVELIEAWVRDQSRTRSASPVETTPGVSLFVRDDISEELSLGPDFESMMNIDGEVFREAPGRRTVRVGGKTEGKAWFIKTHTGVGWQEIIKNLSYFRLPVLGATNEWHGVHWLRRLGIDTMRIAGYGTTAGNPAKRRSFLMTEEITDSISLEDYCRDWNTSPPRGEKQIRMKRWLINTIAKTARVMHASGANHRDFYLCHFLLKTSPELPIEDSRLYLIDLHRMQLRRRTPTRWVIKDLAGLYYSSMEIGLSKRDLFRFMRAYSARPLRQLLSAEDSFWSRVESRATTLYETEQRRAERRASRDSSAQSATAAR